MMLANIAGDIAGEKRNLPSSNDLPVIGIKKNRPATMNG
jgi:hypothetical protein